ncbi:MAG TPA: hypothetical protein DEQ09_06035 [Bacteroidales bacterium]|nr:hypothetical protein [Bacteroidales bacterium]
MTCSKMKNLLLFMFIFPLLCYGQDNHTISGKITDMETGEDLIGVSVLIPALVKGVATNSYGFYSLSLPEGTYTITYSYMGYEPVKRELYLIKNQVINIEMKPAVMGIDEVTVSSERDDRKISSTGLGIEKISMKNIEPLPVIFGEKDILKTIQLLPGISNSTEGSTGFNVRGGSMGQNLILLDEAPVYSASHLAGFFSVFNSGAIKDATVYKGHIPASFGGRASSVLDIKMNNGNNKVFSMSGGLGLVSSRLTLEAPIIKDKMSFILSGRRTYADLLARAVIPDIIIRDDLKFYFYDLNAKLNYSINPKNRIFLSGFFGQDIFSLGNEIGTSWGNTTGTFRWNHIFSDRLFTRTSLIYSRYNYGFIFGQTSMRLRTGIEDIIFKEDATWYINPENTFKFGIKSTYHYFKPGELTVAGNAFFEIAADEKRALENAVYIQNEQKFNKRLSANYGIRVSGFSQAGPAWFYEYESGKEPVDSTYYDRGKLAHPYYSIEPRLGLNYILNKKNSLKISYNRMSQYLHLLSNNTSGSPADVWLPCSNNLKPVLVDHVSAGFFRNLGNNSIETSIEVYYKNMTNTTDYKDGADIIFDEHVESQVLKGMGRSYGIELYAGKKDGRLTGWISYTLSRTENKIEGINNYDWYPVRYDRTSDISVVISYKLSRRLIISGVWVYATGNAVTFPSGKYVIDNNPVPFYTERNGYRMPAYHRLDISLTIKGKEQKKFESGWDFSIYNAYNRHNAYTISFRESETSSGTTEAVKLSLFGIVPSITWKFKF